MKWFIILLLGAMGVIGFMNWGKIHDFLNKKKGSESKELSTVKPLNNTNPSIPEKGNVITKQNPQIDPIEEKYPFPDFKPIENLVGNWEKIPSSAFPRQVTVKVKAKYIFAGGAGSSTIPAGRKTTALSFSGNQLIIAPSAQSKIRGKILINDTDYKEILGSEYEKYKNRKRKEVMTQRHRARLIAAEEEKNFNTQSIPSQSVTIATASKLPKARIAEYENRIGKIPKRGNDGRVRLMVSSLMAGEVSEIKLNEISHWGPIRYEIVDGQPYWTGTVTYNTTSLFGTFPTEAMALMRNDKVINWLYTGSLEEVP
ncbi:MAG: hypothetical protein VX646_04100 [Verrucomicrobiota bacterium]|nr:hypothetical protein [Verrucomicrobiota bacterium]MED6299331.1 hypothetical protein [Verrucomicrobiota bacterium]MEE2967042.1 hypothetical protein [Verrucomicrobiota bacterium]MEE3175787.1 hypothetical protein [Verrucomicrobiota bacterium]